MLILLPPSETKRGGGADASALDLASLSFRELTPQREAVLAGLRLLSRNLRASTAALGLGPTQRFEIDRNRLIMKSAIMPAIERYTGVVYDALDAETLSLGARAFAANNLVIHSALFGLLRAEDRIPAYRLSHNSRLPGVSLGRTWRPPLGSVIQAQSGLILDFRSEAYAALGPMPHRESCLYLRVRATSAKGQVVALSHFNKSAKGHLARAILEAKIDHATVDSLIEWATSQHILLSPGQPGELDLLV
jgi:uncharacterized protein